MATVSIMRRAASIMDGHTKRLISAILLAMEQHEITILDEHWIAADSHLLRIHKTGAGETTSISVTPKDLRVRINKPGQS